jgi:hypothetical protein
MVKFLRIAIFALCTSSAFGNEVRSIALLSVLGDNISVVSYRPNTGSHIDQNRHSALNAGDRVVDSMVMSAAATAVKTSGALSDMQVSAINYPGANDALTWLDGKKFTPPAELSAVIARSDFTHLMLILPQRAPSMLKVRKGSVGSGHLEGIGFYVDRDARMRRSDTGEVGIGFLAPYAYIKVILVNLALGEVVREQMVTASNTISAARNKEGFDPWDALDSTQKVAAINRLVRAELNKVVPAMLQ